MIIIMIMIILIIIIHVIQPTAAKNGQHEDDLGVGAGSIF